MSYRTLDDEDVRALPMADAVAAMERAVRRHAAGDLRAPPRWAVDAVGGEGSLVFTAGAAPEAVGFRVYETFPETDGERQQLVALWDGRDGRFRGLVLGHYLGVYRTAGINGVAVDHLAREDASVLGVLGTGPQARAGAQAACAARSFNRVRVYSPTREHRETFAERMPDRLGVPVEAAPDAESAVRGADVLYCATDSETPAFDADWLSPGAHVHSLGPKFAGAHELPHAVAASAAAVVTDSLAQVEGYADYRDPFFLDPDGMVELGDVVTGGLPTRDPDDVTLFCSVGLAGTEVVLADALFEAAGGE